MEYLNPRIKAKTLYLVYTTFLFEGSDVTLLVYVDLLSN